MFPAEHAVCAVERVLEIATAIRRPYRLLRRRRGHNGLLGGTRQAFEGMRQLARPLARGSLV